MSISKISAFVAETEICFHEMGEFISSLEERGISAVSPDIMFQMATDMCNTGFRRPVGELGFSYGELAYDSYGNPGRVSIDIERLERARLKIKLEWRPLNL